MPELAGVTIWPPDIKRAGICMRGTRGFFAEHGLSWPDFVVNGVPAQTLWDTGDGYAQRVVKAKIGLGEMSDG